MKMTIIKQSKIFRVLRDFTHTILLVTLFGLSHSQFVSGQCLRRNCDQFITGRDLQYNRAFEIIKSEEYLTEADREEGRREDVDTSSPIVFEDYDDSFAHSRFKRTISTSAFNATQLTEPATIFGFVMYAIVAYAIVTIAQGVTANSQAPSPLDFIPSFDLPAAVSNQRSSFVLPPEPTSFEVPQPGTPGGGLLPSDNSPDVLAGLALVPEGLTAVAIFPPTPNQQVPALSVIFSESGRTRYRRRVSPYSYYEEPVYGIVTQALLVQDQLCELGRNCDANGYKLQNGYQTSESRRYYHSVWNNVNRQTRQEFSASGPPRCSASNVDSVECRRNY